MTSYLVIFSKRADRNLLRILAYIAKEATVHIATSYVLRLRAECLTLSSAPHRGDRTVYRGRIVRRIGFERSATILFNVVSDRVEIVTVQYRGRNLKKPL